MSTASPTQPDLTTRRVQVFEQRYGSQALDLACHAAFPLSLTPELLYCLRENFVSECPWYAVADVLLSGLCNTVVHDLYAMEGKTRDSLLRRLKNRFGENRLWELADFMEAYIQSRLGIDGKQVWAFGTKPQWTALACLRPSEAKTAIEQALREIAKSGTAAERLQLTTLAETYEDLLAEVGFEPLLILNEMEEEGVEAFANNLPTFSFETVTVNRRGEIIERQSQTARYYREDLGKGVSLDMVYIPGGSFMMGAPEGEKESPNDERPQHQVTVQPFFMGKYAITQAQWRAVAALPKLQRDLKPDPSRFKRDNRPVEKVNWYDAVEFCARLSVATGRQYVLPSEAQWEYACRANTTTPFHFGETITAEIANYNGNYTYADEPKGECRAETTPVGSFPPNSFGLYDMHGNVWECCADPWHDNYEKAPTDGKVWDEECNDNRYQNYAEYLTDMLNNKSNKLIRGGSWIHNPRNCRSADRNLNDPGDAVSDYGFRVVGVSPRTP